MGGTTIADGVAVDGPTARGGVLVVGLAGPSGVGKTSLSDRLAGAEEGGLGPGGRKAFDSCVVLHGDHYFFAKGPPPPYAERPNMETPDLVDWASLLRDLDATKRQMLARVASSGGRHVILVESFLLLAHAPLVQRMDLIFVQLADRETCLTRRLSRSVNRTPAEAHDLAVYFAQHVWPSFEEHTLAPLRALQRGGDARLVVVETATRSPGLVLEHLLDCIQGFFWWARKHRAGFHTYRASSVAVLGAEGCRANV